MKPIIGIIVCGIKENKQFVTAPYISAIICSGGIPVIIPCPISRLDPSSLNQLSNFFATYYNYCNSFLFCGGSDISPLLFNQPPLDNSNELDIKMDIFQIAFMEYLLKKNKPLLGICRGMQIMNVALGGTLYQDLSQRKELTFSHMQNSLSRNAPSHLVTIKENSILYSIFKNHIYTNSFHHQAILKPGKDITICGYTEDGIIEAIEIKHHPFAIGVQWHPECMYKNSPSTQELFFKFIKNGVSLN